MKAHHPIFYWDMGLTMGGKPIEWPFYREKDHWPVVLGLSDFQTIHMITQIG